VFYKDTLKLILCTNCYLGPLAQHPAIFFNHFSLEKNGSYNFLNPQKNGFSFCTTVKVDSSSAQYKSDFIGKWRLKGRGSKMHLILKNITNCNTELDGYFPPKSQKKGKVIYSVAVLTKDEMVLVRKK